MNKVAIFTDFSNFDPAYSLCRVVQSQVRMLVRGGYRPVLLVRKGFQQFHAPAYDGAEIVELDPGTPEGNEVQVSEKSGEEIAGLAAQLREVLKEVDVVLTHDLIYQPSLWKHHVAARRVAKFFSGLHWYHWVHSATNLGVAEKVEQFRQELRGKFPGSKLVAMHAEEVNRKGSLYGYEQDEIVIVPNPVDFLEDFHPAAKQLVEKAKLMAADIVGFFPCRLDRGKQAHILIEVFAGLCKKGFDARVVIADFHSIAGDKLTYREEMRKQAEDYGVPVFFTSDLEGTENGAPFNYCIPHKAVLDIMELADVLVHPSRSESDPLILPEAAWKRCGLVLNFDLPVFRQYDGQALMYKFSSAIDVMTGMPGETKTEHSDRAAYMAHVAAGIAYQMEHNSVLRLHAKMRKERSLEGVWPKLWAVVEA